MREKPLHIRKGSEVINCERLLGMSASTSSTHTVMKLKVNRKKSKLAADLLIEQTLCFAARRTHCMYVPGFIHISRHSQYSSVWFLNFIF